MPPGEVTDAGTGLHLTLGALENRDRDIPTVHRVVQPSLNPELTGNQLVNVGGEVGEPPSTSSRAWHEEPDQRDSRLMLRGTKSNQSREHRIASLRA